MKLRIKYKIIIPFLLVFCITSVVYAYITNKTLSNETHESLYEKLDTDWRYIEDLLDLTYGEEWSSKNNNLYKGETNLSDGTLEKSINNIFDYHLNATGTWSFIFVKEDGAENNLKYTEDTGYLEGPYLGIAGSIRGDDGNRIIHTRIQKEIADTIESTGEYKGETNVSGEYINCIYRPLKDSSGETVGILAVGRNSSYIHSAIDDCNRNILLVCFAGLIAGATVFTLIASNIARRMQSIIHKLNEFKDGNLNVRCTDYGTDEVADIALGANHMFSTVSALFENMEKTAYQLSLSSDSLKNSATVVDNSGQDITSTITELAEGISNQVSNLDSAARLTNNLSLKLNILLDESLDMASLSNEINKTNKETITAVLNLKEKTQLNDSATSNIAQAVCKLSDRTKNIESILSSITYIANKTNLLSLNSSIEAARAGDAGRGFSVLAVETGNLANASSKAVREIETIIHEIKVDVEKSIEAVKNVRYINNEQADSFNNVNLSFNKISSLIDDINDRIENINVFIQEINTDKEVISDAINQVYDVSEKSSAATQEMTSTIEDQFNKIRELKEESSKLDSLAKELKKAITI